MNLEESFYYVEVVYMYSSLQNILLYKPVFSIHPQTEKVNETIAVQLIEMQTLAVHQCVFGLY